MDWWPLLLPLPLAPPSVCLSLGRRFVYTDLSSLLATLLAGWLVVDYQCSALAAAEINQLVSGFNILMFSSGPDLRPHWCVVEQPLLNVCVCLSVCLSARW